MRETEDLTKYLYSENGDEKYDKVMEMDLDDRRRWYQDHKRINQDVVSQHKSDEMHNMLGLGTIRDLNGEVIIYYDLDDNTLIKKLSQCKIEGLENAPRAVKRIYNSKEDREDYYYIPNKNRIFSSLGRNGVCFYSLNTINDYYWYVSVQYPAYSFSANDSYYENERRHLILNISDVKTDCMIAELIVDLCYCDMHIFSYDTQDSCKIIKFDIINSNDKKQIICRYIADTFIVDVDNQRRVVKSVNDLESLVIWEFFRSNRELKTDVQKDPNSFSVIFNEIRAYLNKDFRTEKEKEEEFILGYSLKK